MRKAFWGVGFLAVGALGFVAGWTLRPSEVGSPVSEDTSATVASWGGGEVTSAELQRFLQAQSPTVRASYATAEGRKDLLERLVRQELLAAEAARRGFLSAPEVVHGTQELLAQSLLAREFGEGAAHARASDAELRAYYDAHQADYERPEAVRASVLFVQVPAAETARRQEKLRALGAILKGVRTENARDPLAFARAVRQHSEHPSRVVDGDLRFRTLPQLEAEFGRDVAGALWGTAPGAISDVLTTPAGLVIAKVHGRQQAARAEFGAVREQLIQRLESERRDRALAEFLTELHTRAAVRIEQDALAQTSL